MAKAAGCAAKLSPRVLDSVLRELPRQTDANVLVSFDTSDDAGVYQIGPNEALVQTADFFTPIVDDPTMFGQISAANALSDVYAMGGRPVSSLSLVCFPERGDPALLREILRGGLAKMSEAGCFVLGGHSIRDDDLKFGYAVTGLIDPRRVWRNVGAKPGDALLLTKPLGTGVITTALKKSRAPAESVAAAMACMAGLNRDAAEALAEIDPDHTAVHAVTDVTGFGLLGHAREMALGQPSNGLSAVSIEIDHSRIEYLPGAENCARGDNASGGLHNNREFIGDCASFAARVAEEYRLLLFDPQTSGGLLAAVAPEKAEAALEAFARRNVSARRIGRIEEKGSALLQVI
jgi:selenide, water dikinase